MTTGVGRGDDADRDPRSASADPGPSHRPRASARHIVGAFVAKDLRVHARDRFYVVVTIVSLVFFVGVFWLLPATLDETVTIGVHAADPAVAAAFVEATTAVADDSEPDAVGLEVEWFTSSEALRAAVADGDRVVVGLDLPEGFLTTIAAGDRAEIAVVVNAAAPPELRPALRAMVRELAFAASGQLPPVELAELDELVVGTDRIGAHLSLRDQMRPLFVFIALFVEMFALASLVAGEIQLRTITAVLATPVRLSQVLGAKTAVGTLLAFGQAAVLMIATGAATTRPGLLAVALLLGGVMVTGIGLIAGSIGKDFVEVVFWSFLVGMPVLIPGIGAILPGTAPTWIQVLPSHGLVEILVGTTARGEGWAAAGGHLAALAAWCVVLYGLGVTILRRRVARL